jgi:DNA polymerase III subunit delta'
MLFEEIIGQSDIKRKLLQTVREQRVGHAMLFVGKEGAGKLGLAIAFARYMNCENPGELDSCSECSSCRKYSKLIHPDLHFVFPIAAKKDVQKGGGKSDGANTPKVSSDKGPVSDDFLVLWRESVLSNPYMRLFQWYELMGIENKQGSIGRNESRQILKKLSLKSFEAKYKVMIIWMAEKMNTSASNTLLKLFEEPPPNTVFMLIAEDASQIIPTILSRTQIVRIPKIDRESMEAVLMAKHGITDKKRIDSLVRYADGNYLQLIEEAREGGEINFNLDMFVKLMRLCFVPDIVGIGSWIDGISGIGREKQKQFLQYAIRIIRGSFIINIKAGDIDLLSAEEKEFSEKFSKFVHPGNVFPICEEFGKAYVHIEYNGYNRLVLFDLAIKIARLLKA